MLKMVMVVVQILDEEAEEVVSEADTVSTIVAESHWGTVSAVKWPVTRRPETILS